MEESDFDSMDIDHLDRIFSAKSQIELDEEEDELWFIEDDPGLYKIYE